MTQDVMRGRIMVIDCATQMILSLPPHSNYICLSYVWGTDHLPTPEESALLKETHPLPHNLPKTVRDACPI
ncbi:uncharacterized protein Z518_00774 [Rhinocladiella mackenziei CBS 650.93]|uniref:Heterokaryon incompatibility domain-containing protein n=1 Tax=Rhinocladiella mackenziei CBS 650.93 TaxID=1442369 RepID=A0A0D2HG91_9EURO|nr:uncharacterized protein Z518_00774 [Rhinocladiella mackenziei CBS 650.93]KIX09693.1 hypothetical protein Z518_00774 [Rhinocladiella mackenziei CBS 650.93]